MSLSSSSLKTLKVTELKELCTKSSLSSSGKKEELIARLTDFLDKNDNSASVPSNETEKISKPGVNNNLSQTPALEPVPESGSNYTGDTTAANKTNVGFGVLGLVSLSPSVNGNDLTNNSQVTIQSDNATKPNSHLTDSEKARLRAERFGTSSSGSSIAQTAVVNEEEERLRKRAERFGPSIHPSSKNVPQPKERIGNQLASSLTAIASISQEEKLRLRAERFGVDLSSFSKNKVVKPMESKSSSSEIKLPTSSPDASEDKLKLEARAKRFKTASSSLKDTLSPLELEKLAKRAERFGLNKS